MHVLPAASACPDASLRARVWDVAEVPESIPLSPLLPPGNEMCSDVDSSSLPISFCCSLSLYFSLSLCHLFLSPSFVFGVTECFPHCPAELMVDCSIHLLYLEGVNVDKEHKAVTKIYVDIRFVDIYFFFHYYWT